VKIAFVAPFYGAQAAGGAEAECRQTAHHLAARGVTVDVLTTCLLDLQHDWNVDAHAAGLHPDGPVRVRRFRSARVDRAAFEGLNRRVMEGVADETEQRRFAAQHVSSPDLFRHLADHGGAYDRLVFIPYPFGATIYGSRMFPEKSVLIPCLHDEGYARIAPVRELFARCARIVFHTAAEERLAVRLYGDLRGRGRVIGEGVETNLQADGRRFREKYGIHGPFLLYAGRKDISKNTPQLADFFCAARAARRHGAKLVLIGPGTINVSAAARDTVVDLGFVPAQDKLDAYAAAAVFCQPSRNESFSLVLMEAWDLGVPALVHGGCEVLRDHVVSAGGGLYFRNAAEFDAALAYLLENPETARVMGRAGRDYVRAHYAWDRIMDRYLADVFA